MECQFINTALANPVLDVLLPFFSAQYLLIPSLVILAALLYVGTAPFRNYVLRIFLALLLAGLISAITGRVAGSAPPFMTGLGRAFINDTWRSLESGVPVPLEPLQPFPYGACLAAILLFAFAGIRRWTLWLTIPLNACALLAPVYCGWCWSGATLTAWSIGAASFLGVQLLGRDRSAAGSSPSPPLLRELPWERRILSLILAGWTVLSFVGLYHLDYTHFGIQYDESQYWYWTRHLQLCYYSKPVMIALIDYGLTRVLGDTTSALRTGGILFFAAALLPVYALTKRITGKERAALVAAVLLASTPEFSVFVMTMDTNKPAYLIWATVLYTSHRAFHGERRMWPVTGFLIGLGLMTRYTFPFLAGALALTVIIFYRRRLREWGPYLAFLCALLCILGWLYWQYEHNFVTLEDIQREGQDPGQVPTSPFGFLTVEMVFVSPVIFLLFLYSIGAMAVKCRKNADAGMLMLAFLVPFVAFVVLSCSIDAAVAWTQVAYLGAAPAAAWIVTESRWRRLMTALLTIGIAIALPMGPILYNFCREDPCAVVEADQAVEFMQSHSDLTEKNAPFILATNYGAATTLSFYIPGHPDVHCPNGTLSCHDLCAWTDWSALVGRDALIVLPGGENPARDAIELFVTKLGAFTSGEYVDNMQVKRGGQVLYDLSLVRFHNFSGQELCGNY